MNYFCFIILITAAIKSKTIENKLVNEEKMLIDKLLKDDKYDKNMRPEDTVQIKFSLYLNQIITLIEQEQILVLNVFLDHEWRDKRLQWKPENHRNISLLRIDSELLWT
jgi:hypothetical protein